jgi:hypothetical protein
VLARSVAAAPIAALPHIAAPAPVIPTSPTSVETPRKPRQITLTVTITVPEWFWHVRRSLPATFISAVGHMVLLIVLGIVVSTPPKDPPPQIRLNASLPMVAKHPKHRPIVTRVERQTASAAPPNAGVVIGRGSTGRRSAGASGLSAGMPIAPPKVDALLTGASGGDGRGAEQTFGDHLSVSVGVPNGSGDGAEFFNVKAAGKNFAFVVDTSGSMFENARYLRCRQELIESIRSLRKGQKYFVAFFNDEVHAMPGRRLVDAGPERIGRTISWIHTTMPTGTTEPWAALYLSLRMKPDAIYLLTDGNFADDVLEKIMAVQGGSSTKIPIHTIAFESEEGATLLRTIARATGGTFRFVR